MKKFILKKISVFFILSIAIIVFCFKIIIFDYTEMDDIGFVGMALIIFIGIAIFGLLLDYVLSLLSKNRMALNIIELIIVFLLIVLWKFRYGFIG